MQNENIASASSVEIVAPNIAEYMDYRKFLLDYYNYRKNLSRNEIRGYNYQVFSAAANIKSPNDLKMTIEGKRNLSDDMIVRFAKALALSKDQIEEFKHLVNYSQATEPAERNQHLRLLSEFRVEQKLKSGEIDRKTWEKIPNWIAWVLYAMIDQEGVKFDLASLKKSLRNKATENEIELALQSLIDSGELTRDAETGEVKKAHTLIESPEDVPVALVRKLQAELMYLGLESLFQDTATEREFGSLTLSLTKQEFEDLKFQLRKLRKTIHKDQSIKRMGSKGERVYQLNLQLFPVTNPITKIAGH